jgi:TolB-like protein
MKNKILIILLAINYFGISQLTAQTINNRQSIGLMNVDAHGASFDQVQMINVTHIELLKLKLYEVIDRHDIDHLLEQENINRYNCYNTTCLIDVGKKLNADKMLTGSVEVLGEKIIINFRLIDVKMERVIKNEVWEYLNLPNQVHAMIRLTLQKMFDKNVDNDLMNKLTQESAYSNAINVPNKESLNLNGPRLGLTIFTGDLAEGYSLEKAYGGYEATPVMLQFGYQFEVQYLSTGNYQALFEFIPLFTGLDQGLFIPSCSFLHGLRNNKYGYEFAFGPIFSVVKLKDIGGDVHIPSPEGDPTVKVGFVFGIGKTFRSGELNFPVNAFFLPGKSGHRYGISIGFNKKSYASRQ